MRGLLCWVLLLAATACANVAVPDRAAARPEPGPADGKRVALVLVPPPSSCQPLGEVAHEQIKVNEVVDVSHLLEDEGAAQLRNVAGQHGADTVLVHSPRISMGTEVDSIRFTGTAYRCAVPVLLTNGQPAPEGAFHAVVRSTTTVRRGPASASVALTILEAGTRVLALETAAHGFRRVRNRDGSPLGYVLDDDLELAR